MIGGHVVPPDSTGKPASSEAADTATPKETGRKIYTAPNRIVLWDNLKDTVNKNLAPCPTCHSSNRSLVIDKSITLHSSSSINCVECTSGKKQLYHNVKYELVKLKGMKRKNKRDKKTSHRTAGFEP